MMREISTTGVGGEFVEAGENFMFLVVLRELGFLGWGVKYIGLGVKGASLGCWGGRVAGEGEFVAMGGMALWGGEDPHLNPLPGWERRKRGEGREKRATLVVALFSTRNEVGVRGKGMGLPPSREQERGESGFWLSME